jgi:hypothetical protein
VKSHALPSFWKCDEDLPRHVQKLADKNFTLFKANPHHPSLGIKKKAASTPSKSVELPRPRGGELYWFWIGTHETYNNFRF